MREMKDSGIEWIGEIPKDWKLEKIKYVADFEPFCDFSNISKEDKISYVPMECIKQGYFQPKIAKYGELPNSLTRFQDNDIAMAKVTPCFENGNIAIMSNLKSKVGLGSSELFVFRAKKVITKYLFYWLQNKDFIEIACSTMTGVGGLKRVSSYFCKNCKMHIPSIEEQNRIADYLDKKCSKIDEIISKQQTVIEKLKEYKLSIITEAVTKGLNPDVTMKDSGVEWIGEIPENWEIRRIGVFAKVTSSKRIFEQDYVYEGVPFYRSKEITDLSKGIDVQTEIYISDETFNIVNQLSSAPKYGDVLLTSIGTIGNVWVSDGRKFYYKDGNITQIEYNDSFNSNYLKYCFSSNIIFEQYSRLAIGSTLLALTIKKIKKMLITFPPCFEQKQIADYLDSKCEKIDFTINKKQKLIDKLAEYKKSLIYEVVTGKKEV